jgi:hypothetical protein
MEIIRTYIETSWELNMYLNGMGDGIEYTIWNEDTINKFIKYTNKVKEKFKEETILYRGTSVLSPTLTPKDSKVCFEIESKGFLSTSKSIDIAKEFTGRKGKGYLHILVCQKGVKHLDMEPYYQGDKGRREQEVLIYPGCKLSLVEMVGKTLVWNVKNDRFYKD